MHRHLRCSFLGSQLPQRAVGRWVSVESGAEVEASQSQGCCVLGTRIVPWGCCLQPQTESRVCITPSSSQRRSPLCSVTIEHWFPFCMHQQWTLRNWVPVWGLLGWSPRMSLTSKMLSVPQKSKKYLTGSQRGCQYQSGFFFSNGRNSRSLRNFLLLV